MCWPIIWIGVSLTAGPRDVSRDRAAVGAVEPAVGPPAQAVGARVRVLQTETLQMHDGRPARSVAVVLGRIEEQIRRIEHPDAAAAVGDGRDDVHAVEKDGVLVVDAASLRVLVDRDDVPAAKVMWGRRRDLVVDDAPENIAAQNLQPRRDADTGCTARPRAGPARRSSAPGVA